jgi:glycoside/pentoside/hexuronide:cation symporter, GPH family
MPRFAVGRFGPVAPMDRPPLRTRTKLLYSCSSLGSEALSQSRGAWLLYFYAPPRSADLHAYLPLGLAGALISANGVIGALYYPPISHWSDRTRSRWGRRLPYIVLATPLWALFALLLFTPPRSGTAVTAVYLVAVLELGSVFSTLSGSPFQALLPEIARSSAERVSVVGYRTYLGAAGGAVGLVAGGLLVDHAGFRTMALVMAAIALSCRYIATAGVWRRVDRAQPPVDITLRRALRATFGNAHFLRVLPSLVLFQMGMQLILGVLPYYVKAVLVIHSPGTWVSILTAVAIACMVMSVPAFSRLARRTSKRSAYRTAMLGAAGAFSLLAVAGALPGIPAAVQLAVVMALAGPPLAGVYLFPDALTADVIDAEERSTGLRREAMYYGSQNLVVDTASSLTPLVLSGLLLLGDTAHHELGIRLVGPIAGAILLAGHRWFRGYDLPDDAGVEAAAA